MTYFDEKLKTLHKQRLQKKRLEAQKTELQQQENDVAKKTAELAEIKKKEQLDLRYCQEQLDKLADCEAEYRDLLEQKKNTLKLEGTQKANDIMLMQKHEHINNAQDMIGDLRNELRRFKTELADVQIEGNIQIEMDDFSKFADWFFDNIFTDWDIKAKIENSLAQAQETREQITGTINTLKDMRDDRQVSRFELQDRLENAVVEG